jgi:hypothetical protein
MRQVNARQLLDGWEAVRARPMPARGASLAAALDDRPVGEVMRWSVTRRDRTLFELRAQLFGDALDAVTSCPACAQRLEMRLTLSEIAPPGDDVVQPEALRVGDVGVSWRAPTSEDLLAIAAVADPDEAREALLARCIATDDPELRERAAAALAEQPADVRLRLTCPSCGHVWSSPFDIAAFLWSELDDWARSTLREIHTIAYAYGWTEDEILGLSARRRRTYVEMIR